MLDINTIKFKREEISPPYIVNSKSLFGTGQLPNLKMIYLKQTKISG